MPRNRATGLELDPPCALINANQRLHHHAKAKLTRAWREAAAEAVSPDWAPHERAHITVAIRFPTNHRRDAGNYFPTAKAIVDGLVDARLIPDDNDENIEGPDLRRVRPNGPARVFITVRDLA